ncbi:hypothetical protein ABG067_002237 [Albugo candida]
MSSAVNSVQDEEEQVLVAVYPKQNNVMVVQVPKRLCISDLEKCLAQEYHAVFPEKSSLKTNAVRILKCIPTVNSVENRYAMMFPELKTFSDPTQNASCFVDLAKNVQVGNAFHQMERVYVIEEVHVNEPQALIQLSEENTIEIGPSKVAEPVLKNKKRPSETVVASDTAEAEVKVIDSASGVTIQPKKKARNLKEKSKATQGTTEPIKVKKQIASKKKDTIKSSVAEKAKDTEESEQKQSLDKKKKVKTAKEIKLDALGTDEKQKSSQNVISSSNSPEVTEIEESPHKIPKKKPARRAKNEQGATKLATPSIPSGKVAFNDGANKSNEKSVESSKQTTTLASKPKAMKREFQEILLAAQERIARDKLQNLQDITSPPSEEAKAVPEKAQTTVQSQPVNGSDSESTSEEDTQPEPQREKQDLPSMSSSTETSEDEFNYSQKLLADLTQSAEAPSMPIVPSKPTTKTSKVTKAKKNREQKLQEEMELLSKNLRKLQKAQAESADSVLSPPLSKNQFSLDQVAVGKLTRSTKNPFTSTTESKATKVPKSRAKKTAS